MNMGELSCGTVSVIFNKSLYAKQTRFSDINSKQFNVCCWIVPVLSTLVSQQLVFLFQFTTRGLCLCLCYIWNILSCSVFIFTHRQHVTKVWGHSRTLLMARTLVYLSCI
jgi:hypothetical protein